MTRAQRPAPLRDAGIRTKLSLIAGAGVLGMLVVATAGIHGLGTVQGHATDLGGVAETSRHLAGLRDAEGDMRVDVHEVARAASPTALDAALASAVEVDRTVDGSVAALHADLSRSGTSTGLAAFDDFTTKLASWRTVRDGALVSAVRAGDHAGAAAVMDGALTDADDAFAAPLDTFAQQTGAQVALSVTAADRSARLSRVTMLLALLLGGLLAVGLAAAVARLVVGPLRQVSAVLERLARGDLTGRTDVRSRDELGQMATALDTALGTLRGTVSALAASADTLAGSAEELTATNSSITAGAARTSQYAAAVSTASTQITAEVATVARGAEEMGESIREIAQNATEAAAVAGEAVRSAATATDAISALGEAGQLISAVVQTITAIAEQTNLLALNATIEAARAGDAGKGFAVVAGEVKDLARETARATEDIGRRVESIRAGTDAAVAVVDDISLVIGRISDYTTTIAAAVEEQTATTGEMTRSVHEAAGGSRSIAATIADVAEAAQTTAAGAADSQVATTELARMATELQGLVGQFRC